MRRTLRPLLVLVGGLVGLGLVEGGVRLLRPQEASSTTANPLLRGRLTEPGRHRVTTGEYDVTLHVNRDGFVDHEWGEAKGRRVVLLGDSFVQAAQVEPGEGIGARLDAALDASLGEDVEVLSMGVPGAGTVQELAVLREYALPRHPDAVVLGFLVSNDVLNNHPLLEEKSDKAFARIEGGRLVPTDPTVAAAPLPWLWERSQAYRLVARWWTARVVAQAKIAAGDGLPVDFRVYQPAPDARWGEAWEITRLALGEMAASCAEAGVPFGVLLFPDRLQVDGEARARAIHDWPAMAGWDFAAPQAHAAAVAGPIAPTADLLPAFAAAPPTPPLYFATDGHWTARGHALAAEASLPLVADLLDHR